MTASRTPAPMTDADPHILRERALAALTTARARTALLTTAVDESDLTAQHSPLMSPLVWDL
ncbi:ergothioneine biosynthesis protein EgtB, partial [Streptomyces turgidiscabies]